jgi:shikimate dehydrogenase
MNHRSNTPSPVPKPGKVLRAALVGSGISASLTPAMHEAEGKYHGLDYTYSRYDTALDPYRNRKLDDIVFKARDDGLAGMNVTHPFKAEVLDVVDDLSDHVKALGASNAIVFTDNGIVAHSTDYSGYFYGFERDLQGCGKTRVLLIGAGGGGAAVAFALASLGIAELLVYDIDPAHARDLVARLNTHAEGMEARVAGQLDAQTMAGLDGLVNATPVGMASYPGSAIDPELLTPELWVSDIVYFPLETELLKTARARGCRVMNGSGMAVYQAVRSFELFSGIKADTKRFEAKFEQLIAARNS